MATWKNLDTLDSFGKLKELKNHVDIAAALSGEEGGKRVACLLYTSHSHRSRPDYADHPWKHHLCHVRNTLDLPLLPLQALSEHL